MDELFSVHSLACSDCDHLVDVVNRAAAAEVVHRTGDTLEDRSDGVSIAEALHELVTDVAHFETWEYEHVCVACDCAAWSLAFAYAWNECCVSLKLAFNLY